MSTKNILAVIVIATALTTAIPASAWTTAGGGTSQIGTYALDFSVGFPEVKAMFHLPVQRFFEVNPTISLYYWRAASDSGPVVGNVFGTQLKLNLMQRGPFQFAMAAEPGLVLNYHPGDTGFGFQVGFPSLLMGYEFGKKHGLNLPLNVFGGIRVPWSFMFVPDIEVRIPVLLNFGAQLGISDRLQVFLAFDMGPDIYAGNRQKNATIGDYVIYLDKAWSRTEFYIGATFGINVRFGQPSATLVPDEPTPVDPPDPH